LTRPEIRFYPRLDKSELVAALNFDDRRQSILLVNGRGGGAAETSQRSADLRKLIHGSRSELEHLNRMIDAVNKSVLENVFRNVDNVGRGGGVGK
jgi:hypothetical protein